MKKDILKTILTFIIFFLTDIVLYLIINLFIKYKPNALYFLIVNILKLIIIGYLYKDALLDIKDKNFTKNLLKSFKYYFIALGLSLIINIILINSGISVSNQNIINQKLENDFLMYLPIVVITTPIIEELVFRENLRKLIKKDTEYIVVTSIIFASMHLINSSTALEYLFIIPYAVLGASLALSRVKTDKIIYPIILHFTNNLLSVLFMLLAGGIV